MRAFVVDDSYAMRLILGRLLRGAGFEVHEACHGRDALEQLTARGPVELALIDWNMPEMNGLELVQALRADGRFAAMKLMMVTTEAEPSRIAAAMRAGADAYVLKPFTTDVLRAKLATLGLTLTP